MKNSFFKQKNIFMICILLCSGFSFWPQSTTNSINSDATSTKQLPNGYRSIFLGMDIDETKKTLKNDSFFGYRGQRDVSLLPSENKSLIETEGSAFLDHSWFQFYNEKLYIITLNFNTTKLDYHAIFTTMVEKYGEPNSLSPEKTTWENKSIKISLEQPCSVKYFDMEIFNSLLDASTVKKANTEIIRQNLLDEF